MATHKNAITTWGEIQVITSPQAYNIAGNYTPVKYTFQLVRTATSFGGYWSNNTSTATLSINGTPITVPNFTYDFRTNYTKVLATGTINITHDPDGQKTFTITASTTTADSVPNGSLSASETLTRIPRTSTFTIPSSFTMGSAFTVSITRASSSFTHWVILYDGGTSLYSSGNTIGTGDSVNVALSTLAARSPNAMSRSFTVQVDTYNGDTWIGRQSKNITANVPTSVKPTFSALTVSENVSTVASLVGAYVQTKSKLNLAITGASGIHGSTIKSYNITGVGHNVNSSSTVTGILSVSGNQTIKGTVIDSRGQSFERSIVVNILPYTPPTLSDLSFRRTLPDKTEAPLGDNATVRASVKVHSLIVNGVQKNSIKYQVQSAQSGGSFATKADTTSTSLTKSYSDVWVGYSVDHSYNFRVRAGDVFGFGGWSVGVIPTGVVTQQWGSKTTSFGKMIDKPQYNVQVGTGGIQSDGPIVDKNGREVPGVKSIPGNNLNNAMAPGFYYWTTGVTNAPVDYGSMVVTAWDGTGGQTAEQLVMKNGSMWIRGKNNSGSNWSAWTTVPKPSDFVVEQGSNYKKWNSGDLEMWGRATGNSIVASYATCTANLPVALSTISGALLSGTVAGPISGQPASIYNSTMNSTSKVTFSLWKLTAGNFAAGTNNVSVDYYIRGRWK